MAVRFSGANQFYEGTIGLGTVTQIAVTCWMKIVVDRNTYSTVWNIDNSSQSSSIRGFQTNTTGTTMELYYHNGPLSGGTTASLSVDTWYFFAININGNNANWRWRADGSGTVNAASFSGASGTYTANRLRLGDSAWTGEWLNGSLAAVKIWTGNLSDAEMDAESPYYSPVKTTGLVAYYPFDTGPSTTDASGNGYTLTGGTGTASDTNPSDLSWPVTSTLFTGWGVPV